MSTFNPVSGMLNTLLGLPNMTIDTQRRIYEHAMRTKDTRLLAGLAIRNDLEPGIDAALKTHPAAQVRAAWLAHPKRDQADLETALANETRSSVLKALGERTDLPSNVYGLLVDKLGISALPALIGNPNIDNDTLHRAVKRYAGLATNHSRATPTTVKAAMAGNPEVAGIVLSESNSLELISEALNTAAPSSANAKRIGRIMTSIPRSELDNWSVFAQREHISSLIEPYLQDQPTRNKLAAMLEGIRLYSASQAAVKLRKPHTKARMHPDTLRKTSSVETMKRALRDAERRGMPAIPLLTALAANDKCPPDVFAALVDKHANHWRDRGLWLAVKNPDKVAALYARWNWIDLDPILERTGKPVETLRGVIEACREKGSIPAGVLQSRYLTAETAHMLPIETFSYGAESIPAEALSAVEELLRNKLTSDQAWETLAVIGREYHGSLGELVIAANSLG